MSSNKSLYEFIYSIIINHEKQFYNQTNNSQNLRLDCLSMKSKTMDDMIKIATEKYLNDTASDLKIGIQKELTTENESKSDINSIISQKLHYRRNSQITQSNLKIELINSISKEFNLNINNFLVKLKSEILNIHLSIDREKLCIDSLDKYINSISKELKM
jgi:hypothetical protein